MTLADFKTYLGITGTDQDAVLQLFLNSSIGIVEGYIDRKLELSAYTEYKNGNAQPEIVLQQYPVQSITTFEAEVSDGVWETVSDYTLDPVLGTIFLQKPQNRGHQNYKIVYEAGYITVPSDIQLAVYKMASQFYNKRTSDGVDSESVAGDSISFSKSSMSQDVTRLLDKYVDYAF